MQYGKFIFKFKILAQLCKYVNYIYKKKPLKSPPMCFSYGYSSPERKKRKPENWTLMKWRTGVTCGIKYFEEGRSAGAAQFPA